MHPFVEWWHSQRGGSCGSGAVSWAQAGPRRGHMGRGCGSHGGDGPDFGDGGSSFGVRRPLRFLADRLELKERQVAEFARILSELKTERAQAEVDRRRSVAAFADAVADQTFSAARAGEGGALRVQSADRLRGAVLKALEQIHALLNTEQRTELAYLIRTGTLAI